MLQNDLLQRYLLFGGEARAFVVTATGIANAARQMHGCTRVTTAALSRALVASAMIAAMQKEERIQVTVNIKGGGIAGDVVCVARPGGYLKGYIEYPQVDLPLSPDGKLDVGFAVGNSGRLSVVRDSGSGEPYVGQVRLVSGEIAEDIAFYMTASEQTPSLLALGERIAPDGAVYGAGGVLIQPMPGCGESVIRLLESAATRYAHIGAMLAEATDETQFAQELLRDMHPELIAQLPLEYRCDCCRERAERVLISMGAPALMEIVEDGKTEELCCSFCSNTFLFTPDQLTDLAAEARGGGGAFAETEAEL